MQYGGGKGKEEWESERLIALIRSLQPHIILNDRAQIPQDIVTPEQNISSPALKDEETGEYYTWETCQTFSDSWGYYRDETSWKTPKMLIDLLVKTVAKDGNLIMNVGPTARGNFDSRANAALDCYAAWMKYHARSIYGCTMAEPEFSAPEGVALTQSEDEKRLYVHLLDFPHGNLCVKGIEGHVEYVQLLCDGSEIMTVTKEHHDATGKSQGTKFEMMIPGIAFQMLDPVIEVFLK